MRLPRFTTRRLMVLVAVVAVGMGMTVMFQRQRRYQALAEEYAAKEQFCRAYKRNFPSFLGDFVTFVTNQKGEFVSETHTAEFERYTRLRMKYERAARYPWLPVPPDPPPPE